MVSVRCPRVSGYPDCSTSRNCTKRGLRCAYMDNSPAAENSSPSSTIGEFAWPEEIVAGTHNWQHTKIFPFPHLQLIIPPNPDNLSTEECRLLFHICTLSANLELNNSARFTTWAHKMPEYANSPYLDCNFGFDGDLNTTESQLRNTRFKALLCHAVIGCTLSYPSCKHL